MPSEPDWQHLDPVVRTYWIVKFSLITILFSLFFVGPSALISLLAAAIGVGVMLVIVALVVLWAVLFYNRYIYYVGRDGVYINRGVFFKSNRMIPYERIQHISVTRGPLMILFGLSDLNIFTAGTASLGSSAASRGMFGAEGYIPGLRDPEPLRRQVWELVKGTRSGTGIGDETHAPASARVAVAAAPAIPSGGELGEILAEVREIRRALEER